MSRIPLPGEGQKIRVVIDALDDEGRGVATWESNGVPVDVVVRGAFPGDSVRAVVERKVPAKEFVVCRMIDLYEDGPVRTERQCPHRAPCPACPLEGLEQSVQLDLKRNRLLNALEDAEVEAAVAEVVTNGDGYRSRQRVKLVVGGTSGALRLGLFAPRSHQLVPAERCPYARRSIEDAIQMLLARLNELKVPAATDDDSGLRAVLLRSGLDVDDEEGVAAILQTGAPLSEDIWRGLVSLVDDGSLLSLAERVIASETSQNSLVSGDVIRRTGPEEIFPIAGGLPVDPDAFCQTDPHLAARMYEMAARFVLTGDIVEAMRPPVTTEVAANDDGDDAQDEATLEPGANAELEDMFVPGAFLDAYAGTGGFSQALLYLGASDVVAIETPGPSANALDELGVQAFKGRVDEVLSDASKEKSFVGVIADPPRKGLRKDAAALAALGAERFCLVSCAPDAFARDVRALVDAGYDLERVIPVDLFPGTPEIEAVSFFRRRPQ